MPNPLEAAQAFTAAEITAGRLPAATTHDQTYPKRLSDGAVHVQYGWDGTPSDADNRENAAVRFTVWTAPGKASNASAFAQRLRTQVLAWGNADVWRVDRGLGRAAGVGDDNELPFCTFTVTFVMHQLTVS